MVTERWSVEMLGGLRVYRGPFCVSRFQSQKVASLLAYLAFYPQRPHLREELLNLLWPDDDIDAARNRLRVGLTSLRHQLEPPGTPTGTVLAADRLTVHLNSEAVATDTAAFESALSSALRAKEDEQARLLQCAVDRYGGDLLPGFGDTWVLTERERLANAYGQALHRLTRCLVQAHDLEGALEAARRAVRSDPLREEAHRDVMRLCLALGRPSAARDHYDQAKRALRETLGATPSLATQKLAMQIEESLGRSFSPDVRLPSAGTRSDAPVAGGDPPPTLMHDSRPQGNLPLFLTRFFGREEQREALRALLHPASESRGHASAARWVTLTGPGGMGKTRLAVAVAESLRPAFAENVWFVPLADISDPRLTAHAIAAAMHLPGNSPCEPQQQVIEALTGRPVLLVLDNCEHLAREIAPFIVALLTHLPELACLLTSRCTLGAEGEREIVVSPLPAPEIETDGLDLLANSGVQLFQDRAQAVQPEFRITPHNVADVAALCRALDGIPLAIELAASRARVMTPAEMRTHLSHRFDLLVNRRADKDMRHRSLRAALEWSYYLLPPELRSLFARLSVFAGGWNLRSARAVCTTEGASDADDGPCGSDGAEAADSENEPDRMETDRDLDLLEKLEQLRIHSLILAEEADGEIRFRMLETLREFAAEQLNPADRARLEARCVRYFVSLARQAETQIKGPRQAAGLRRLFADRDNLRAAFECCLRGDARATDALVMARALSRFWSLRGLVHEGRERCAAALAHPGAQAPTALRADVLIAAGALAADQDDFAAAEALYQQGLHCAERSDYWRGVARVTDGLGVAAIRRGDYERANALFERSLDLCNDAKDSEGLALARIHMGLCAQFRERYAEAKALYEQGLSLYSELADRRAIATTLGNLGMIAELEGDSAGARALHEQSLAVHRDLENAAGIAAALGNLAILAAKQCDFEQARRWFEEARAVFSKLHMIRHLAILKGNLGSLELLQGGTEAACEYYRESLELHRRLNNKAGMIHALSTLGAARITLGDTAEGVAHLRECLRICFETGQQRSLADALDAFAGLARGREQPEKAAWFHGAADALRERIGDTLSAEQTETRRTAYAGMGATLEATALSAAFAAGRDASPEQILREAAAVE